MMQYDAVTRIVVRGTFFWCFALFWAIVPPPLPLCDEGEVVLLTCLVCFAAWL